VSPLPPHLPATADELRARGWNQIDVLLVTGDAHVDHPSFPAAQVGRWLEAQGHRVAVLARPAVDDLAAMRALGEPRLFVGVTAGALDSMVANTTALRRRRSDDAYAPGGRAGRRPDRALTAYCQLARRAFGKRVLVVGGGLEASLRRFAHYDYWADAFRRPLLMDCGADVLIWGMGEAPAAALARRLDALEPAARADPRRRSAAIRDVPGLVYRTPASHPAPSGHHRLPSAEAVAAGGDACLEAFRAQQRHQHRGLTQRCGGMRVIANPPAAVDGAALDRFAAPAFRRQAHPIHGGRPVPALEQVRFAVTSHRGCFGGCAFCAISAHQGRDVISRSRESVLAEVDRIAAHPAFRGTLTDIGGPTANMWGLRCGRTGSCRRSSCLWPNRCRHLCGDQTDYLALLRAAAARPGVRRVFVTTGLRLDLALECPDLLAGLTAEHTSGLLKVAPEHLVDHVLQRMHKPAGDQLTRFLDAFAEHSRPAGRQFVLPYFMAAHPGCRLEDMLPVALFLRRRRLRVDQVQIFTPTPGTAASVMYATGRDPTDGRPVFVERSDAGKRLQKALLLSHLPQQAAAVRRALQQLGRLDLLDRLSPAPRRNRRRG
jgi:uncharacterized radical SAM protein YgiQ